MRFRYSLWRCASSFALVACMRTCSCGTDAETEDAVVSCSCCPGADEADAEEAAADAEEEDEEAALLLQVK